VAVFVPSEDAVYVTSNRLADGSIKIGKAVRSSTDGSWRSEDVPTDIAMPNGGVNHGPSSVLFCAQGTRTRPGGLVLMDLHSPPSSAYATKTLVEGYHGRWFNSVNDVVVCPADGSVWFTDPVYGFEQGFRDRPQLPGQVYRFEPASGDLRVVADGLGRPNGLCFATDGGCMYITDTDWFVGFATRSRGRMVMC